MQQVLADMALDVEAATALVVPPRARSSIAPTDRARFRLAPR